GRLLPGAKLASVNWAVARWVVIGPQFVPALISTSVPSHGGAASTVRLMLMLHCRSPGSLGPCVAVLMQEHWQMFACAGVRPSGPEQMFSPSELHCASLVQTVEAPVQCPVQVPIAVVPPGQLDAQAA